MIERKNFSRSIRRTKEEPPKCDDNCDHAGCGGRGGERNIHGAPRTLRRVSFRPTEVSGRAEIISRLLFALQKLQREQFVTSRASQFANRSPSRGPASKMRAWVISRGAAVAGLSLSLSLPSVPPPPGRDAGTGLTYHCPSGEGRRGNNVGAVICGVGYVTLRERCG